VVIGLSPITVNPFLSANIKILSQNSYLAQSVIKLIQYDTKTCGIYTHHQRRSNPEEYGFNVACLEGINAYDYAPAPVYDGVNHPSDQD